MMTLKRFFFIVMCFICILIDIPFLYSYPQGLASRSMLEVLKGKKVKKGDIQIIEARLGAIQSAISEGITDPKEIKRIDRRTVRGIFAKRYSSRVKRWLAERRILLKYRFNYERLIKMMRGKRFKEGIGRRVFLGILALLVEGCVFDTSGIPPFIQDAMPDSDSGISDGNPEQDATPGIYTITAQSGKVSPVSYLSSACKPTNSPGSSSSVTATDTTIKMDYNVNLLLGDAGMELSPYTVENIALQTAGGTAVASSEFDPNHSANMAIDGIRGKWDSGEWASKGEMTPWWLINFSKARDVHTVRLYDRSNLLDHIKKATLTFSDGSSIAVGEGTSYPLQNDGNASVVSFIEKKGITWIKLQITESDSTTLNAGLSEFEALVNTSHEDLVAEGLTVLKMNMRGSNPCILRLTDNNGQSLSILIQGLDTTEFRSVTVNLTTLAGIKNPSFNLIV